MSTNQLLKRMNFVVSHVPSKNKNHTPSDDKAKSRLSPGWVGAKVGLQLGRINNFYFVFCDYLVDGHFEIGTNFLDGYFLNELVQQVEFQLIDFLNGFQKNFMSHSQFGVGTGENILKNQLWRNPSNLYSEVVTKERSDIFLQPFNKSMLGLLAEACRGYAAWVSVQECKKMLELGTQNSRISGPLM